MKDIDAHVFRPTHPKEGATSREPTQSGRRLSSLELPRGRQERAAGPQWSWQCVGFGLLPRPEERPDFREFENDCGMRGPGRRREGRSSRSRSGRGLPSIPHGEGPGPGPSGFRNEFRADKHGSRAVLVFSQERPCLRATSGKDFPQGIHQGSRPSRIRLSRLWDLLRRLRELLMSAFIARGRGRSFCRPAKCPRVVSAAVESVSRRMGLESSEVLDG